MAVHSTPTVRRHDIDWLRVILFGLLIPFHVAIGIYWSTYGADVNPNIDEISAVDGREFAEESDDYSAESVDFTSMVLHWMHQWRLAALFMISGMGTAFAFKRRTWQIFLQERVKRLLIPMFFGAWTMGFAGSVILGGGGDDGVESHLLFLVRDSLEEPDLLGPGIREAVGAGASVVPVEPIPVLADPYPAISSRQEEPGWRTL